jgi:hypothetical protein
MILEYNSTTTLNRIRDASPCQSGWKSLLLSLGKTEADDEPLDLLTVLDSNGFGDAGWVLDRAMPDARLARHFRAWCCEQMLPLYEREYPDDARLREYIEMLRNDDATDAERMRARAAAEAAAWAARDIAEDAEAAAWDAAEDDAEAATWDALDAARAAAEAAIYDDEWIASTTAEDATQEAQLRKMLTQERREP